MREGDALERCDVRRNESYVLDKSRDGRGTREITNRSSAQALRAAKSQQAKNKSRGKE
jgi:hypothetical protein